MIVDYQNVSSTDDPRKKIEKEKQDKERERTSVNEEKERLKEWYCMHVNEWEKELLVMNCASRAKMHSEINR